MHVHANFGNVSYLAAPLNFSMCLCTYDM
uniref:Uncharacterized protein n=1 Tax=Anguilla anguilla TaxID=7936 RepID=A0A0E9VXA8_ANGAN